MERQHNLNPPAKTPIHVQFVKLYKEIWDLLLNSSMYSIKLDVIQDKSSLSGVAIWGEKFL